MLAGTSRLHDDLLFSGLLVNVPDFSLFRLQFACLYLAWVFSSYSDESSRASKRAMAARVSYTAHSQISLKYCLVEQKYSVHKCSKRACKNKLHVWTATFWSDTLGWILFLFGDLSWTSKCSASETGYSSVPSAITPIQQVIQNRHIVKKEFSWLVSLGGVQFLSVVYST